MCGCFFEVNVFSGVRLSRYYLPQMLPLCSRIATPEEVAAMVVYLCSPRASATNGAALVSMAAWSDLSCEPGNLPTLLPELNDHPYAPSLIFSSPH